MPFPASLWFCGMRATGPRPSRRRDGVFQSTAALLPPPTALDQPGAGARHRTAFSGYAVCISEGAVACDCPTGPPLSRTSAFLLSEVRRSHSRCVLIPPQSATSASRHHSCGRGQMFNQDASSTDKDLLRPSLRSRVSALGAALKPVNTFACQSTPPPPLWLALPTSTIDG